jgi:copper chaperone CopZ
MMVIGRVMGKRILTFYLLTIATLSLLMGLTLNLLLKWTGTEQSVMGHVHQEMLPGWLYIGASLVLAAFLLRHFTAVWQRKLSAPKSEKPGVRTLAIVGMHCSHCAESVHDALSRVSGVQKVEVILERGTAQIEGTNLKDDDLRQAVEGLGYKVGAN